MFLLWLLYLPAYGQSFTFYTYHNKPPYYFSDKEGAKYEHDIGFYKGFVDYLNRQQANIKVKLEFRPRVRLEQDLKSGKLEGAIMGVNPIWFDDKTQTKYLWSAAFMMDKDIILVAKGNVFSYQHPQDFEGKTLVLSRGLYYWGVSERIKQKKVNAYLTDSDEQNLGMVSFGRADATIMSESTAHYFFHQQFDQKKFEVLKQPHDAYERKILFLKRDKNILNALQPHIKSALKDEKWTALLQVWTAEH